MRQWLDILRRVTSQGEVRQDRTGVGTRSLFGETLKFDLRDGFPAVTTKQLAFKQMAGELSCFVRGLRHLDDFHAAGCTIWDANAAQTTGSRFRPADPEDLGRIYGVQWRDWRAVELNGAVVTSTDQLADLIEGLRTDPFSRRHLVTAWNPGELGQMCLPPCHTHFQAYVREGITPMKEPWLDLAVYMRSVDLFLGLPFDVASYALLQHLLAKDTGCWPGTLTFFLGDAHVYLNHLDAVATVLGRTPLGLPALRLAPEASTLTFLPAQAQLIGYQHQGRVAAEMAV